MGLRPVSLALLKCHCCHRRPRRYADLLTKLGAAHTVETAAYKAANLKSGQQLKTIQGTTLTVTK